WLCSGGAFPLLRIQAFPGLMSQGAKKFTQFVGSQGPTRLPRSACRSADEISSQGGGLAAVGDAELGEDVRDVDAHGLLADDQVSRDRLVGGSGGEEVEDLAFTGC